MSIAKPNDGATGWGDTVRAVIDKTNSLDVATHAASSADRDRGLPVFARVGDGPIITAAGSAMASISWPWAVKVAGLIGSPLAPYYLWLSTDHDTGPGGIELWTATAPAGPWTSHGVVYTDTTAGSQTETPSVVWNPTTGLLHMYYQQTSVPGAVDQATLLATSPDGITWTRVGLAIYLGSSGNQPGDGHCGYFQPILHGDKWVGFHLKGGQQYPHFGMSHSLDGITWSHDPRPIGYGAEWYAQTGQRRTEMNSGTVITWRGRRLWIGLVSSHAYGLVPKDARMAVAPIAEDLRRLTAPPRIFLPPAGTETANYRSLSVLHDGDELWLYYQTDSSVFVAKGA